MKKILLLLVLSSTFGQLAYNQIVFNKTYAVDSLNMLSVAIEPTQDGGYVVVGGFNWVAGYTALYMRKTTPYGENLYVRVLNDTVGYSTTLLHNSLIRTHDHQFLLSGTIGSQELNRDFILIKFTEQGAVLWERIYTRPTFLEGNAQVIATKDGGYLLHGWVEADDEPTQFYLLKLDSLGAIEWEKIYGENTYAIPFHAEQTTDGGYIISGYNYHNETGYDMYAIKTDSLGNVQWEQNYGTDGDDGSCRVMEIAPNQYALLGIIAQEDVFAPMWTTETQQIFARLDSAGNIINGSVNLFFNQQHNSFNAAYFDPKEQTIVAISLTYTPNPTQPYLDKFSLSGERLLHVPLSTGIGMEDYLRDVEPTPDGGYVLAGFNFKTPSKGWVVKVDSLGNSCGVADCDNYVEPVGISAPLNDRPWSLSEAEVQVLPNPAQDYLVVENHSLEQNATFVLYDVTGRRVLSFIPENQSVVPIEHLPSGVYLYHILNPKNQMLAYGKVSIVR